MTQKELIEQLAKRTQTTKAQAKRNLEALSEILTEALQNGERIKLPGLGTFDIQKSAARKGRNPRTGEPLQIAAKNKVRFKAGSELSGKVY
ncbi:HU family DNA-binding protein [Wandonia haliotis]|uniref:HU family DNA-binding protein n=1 Tax=Wandonia haliotis TaxID=574963 RepID=A0ABN1MQ77_9FLAO